MSNTLVHDLGRLRPLGVRELTTYNLPHQQRSAASGLHLSNRLSIDRPNADVSAPVARGAREAGRRDAYGKRAEYTAASYTTPPTASESARVFRRRRVVEGASRLSAAGSFDSATGTWSVRRASRTPERSCPANLRPSRPSRTSSALPPFRFNQGASWHLLAVKRRLSPKGWMMGISVNRVQKRRRDSERCGHADKN